MCSVWSKLRKMLEPVLCGNSVCYVGTLCALWKLCVKDAGTICCLNLLEIIISWNVCQVYALAHLCNIDDL